jgi:hypothetical protein
MRRATKKAYVRFDEVEDVLTSMDLLALVSGRVKKEPSLWKWAIVGAHSSFQGAMVCVLAGTAGFEAMSPKSFKEWMEWYEGDRTEEAPDVWMADFELLLKRCRKKALVLSSGQSRDVRRLHQEFRNNFAHFMPKTWSIEKAGLPRIILAAVAGVEMLMARDDVSLKMSGNRKRRLGAAIKGVRNALGASSD